MCTDCMVGCYIICDYNSGVDLEDDDGADKVIHIPCKKQRDYLCSYRIIMIIIITELSTDFRMMVWGIMT